MQNFQKYLFKIIEEKTQYKMKNQYINRFRKFIYLYINAKFEQFDQFSISSRRQFKQHKKYNRFNNDVKDCLKKKVICKFYDIINNKNANCKYRCILCRKNLSWKETVQQIQKKKKIHITILKKKLHNRSRQKNKYNLTNQDSKHIN
ncbi:hypothetical protein RFI_34526, partial [Reticulomyxa filosa]